MSVTALVDERRHAIMSSAERLIAVHGYDALRLKDVARDAGVSIGLIQHYFDTRDELLRQTMQAASRRRVERWTSLAADPEGGAGDLRALLTGAVSDVERCAAWLETCAAASRHPELRSDVRAIQDAWRTALRAAIVRSLDAGLVVRPASLDDTVEVLVRLIDGVMLAIAAETEPSVHPPEHARLLVDTAERLLPPTAMTAATRARTMPAC